jgi:hypothetical protein
VGETLCLTTRRDIDAQPLRGRKELTGGCSKRQHDKFHNVWYSLDIAWMIKSRRMRWAAYLARIGELQSAYRRFFENSQWKISFRRPRLYRRMLLKLILNKYIYMLERKLHSFGSKWFSLSSIQGFCEQPRAVIRFSILAFQHGVSAISLWRGMWIKDWKSSRL